MSDYTPSKNLITLDQYKSLTGVVGCSPQNDKLVQAIIPSVADAIENYIDRYLDEKQYFTWQPYFSPWLPFSSPYRSAINYSSTLVMEYFPVNHVYYIGSMRWMAQFQNPDGSKVTNYNFEIVNDYIHLGRNSKLTVLQDSTWQTQDFLFTDSTTLADIKTMVEDFYHGAIRLNIILPQFAGYNARVLKYGSGVDIYGAERMMANTRITDNRIVNFMQDASFLFFTSSDLVSDVQVFCAYDAGYTAENMPLQLRMIAANIIKDIVNRSTNGQASPGSRSDIYANERWEPSNNSYHYSLNNDGSDQSNLDIARCVRKYEKELWHYRKKVI